MNLKDMYSMAKLHIDAMIQLWDDGECFAKYDRETSAKMLTHYRKTREELIAFKKSGFKEGAAQ